MHRALAFLFIVSMLLSTGTMWSQTSDDQSATENVQQQPQSPENGAAPDSGQQQAPSLSSDFPPLSGLEEGTLEPNVAARSFLLFGAQAGQSISSNATNSLGGGTTFTGITHLLGTAALQRLWSRYQAALLYEGGGAFYSGGFSRNISQLHALTFESRVLWRTGTLSFSDGARYMPDGMFGGNFGGTGGIGNLGGLGGLGGGLGTGIGGGGGGRLGFFGQGLAGSLSNTPIFTNISVVELRQALSPRSAITMEGGFNFVHFTKATNGLLVDSQQVTGEAGYNRTLNRRNQLGIVYAYQHFHFPQLGLGTFEAHLAYLEYGHQLSGRWGLTLGAGPQFTIFSSPLLGRTVRLSASGRASVHYRFPKTLLTFSYSRTTTAGSGFFAGADTDLVTATITRPVSRRWDVNGDLGYNHSHRLQSFTSLSTTSGVPSASFQSGFIGGRVTHPFNRNLNGFLNYHFSYIVFDSSFCVNPGTCGRSSKVQTITIGVNWRSRPYRLD